jgi:hypothetical protein
MIKQIEDRRLIARRVYEALCAQYPDLYIAMVLPGDPESVPDVLAPQATAKPT